MGDNPMKTEIEQTVILRLTPEETAWLKDCMAEPMEMEESPYTQKKRVNLFSELHKALDELNY
jgi:hypothetical protein